MMRFLSLLLASLCLLCALARAESTDALPDARPFVTLQGGYAPRHHEFRAGPVFRCTGGFMLDPVDLFLGFRYLRVENSANTLFEGRLDMPMYFAGADVATSAWALRPYAGIAGAVAMPHHRIDSRIARDLEREGTRVEEELDGGFGWIAVVGCRLPLCGPVGIDISFEHLSFSTRVTTTTTSEPFREIVGREEEEICLSHRLAALGFIITL
jgi:hypothetical protein